MKDNGHLYAGFSNVCLDRDTFQFKKGITLRKVYAHLMSPNLMAFTPAEFGKPHPAPWKAAKGGKGIDIQVELIIDTRELPDNVSSQEALWWISSLLKLTAYPFLEVPIISDTSFLDAATSPKEPTFTPFEARPNAMKPSSEEAKILKIKDLEWVKEKWESSIELSQNDTSIRTAIEAWCYSTSTGRTSTSLLTIWGALEQLFSPSKAEIRFRVATNIACFLEEAGESRLELYKEVLLLYNERSNAAHSTKDIDSKFVFQSWVILGYAITRIIENNKLPTQADFEQLLFCPKI